MGQTARELRNEVEERRADVEKDLDALGNKVSPGRALDRKKAAAGRRLSGVREAVMGSAQDVAHGVGDVPNTAARTVRGNPLAVGLIALGGGMLLASLLPKSAAERQLAQSANDGLQQVADELRGAGEQVVADLRDTARDAVSEVKGAASESASHLADEAGSAAKEVAKPNNGQP